MRVRECDVGGCGNDVGGCGSDGGVGMTGVGVGLVGGSLGRYVERVMCDGFVDWGGWGC